MEDKGVILNILKSLDNNNDIVRYCSTNTKIRKICKEYSKLIFGKTYNEIIYSVAIEQKFPSLYHVISLDTLFDYYKSYPKIWEMLHKRENIILKIPMCRSLLDEPFEYFGVGFGPIDPTDPKNISYVAPFHRAILENHKKLTFLFFRYEEKIPTNLFMLEKDEVITPYHFIEMGQIENLNEIINRQSKNFIHDKYNRKTWEKYIQDPFWISKNKLNVEEEIKISDFNTNCDSYSATGFASTDKSRLFQKYFHLDHPAVEIGFNT